MTVQDSVSQEVRDKVPSEAIVTVFGGVMAISPEMYKSIINGLATKYGVSTKELFPYVVEVLQKQPKIDPEDF
jgi:hypothetical protein